jgi:phage tail-like protein
MHPTARTVVGFLSDQVAMTHRFIACIDEGAYDFGSWSKVTGLGVDWEEVTYRPGEQTGTEVFAGAVRYQPITLARAACADSAVVKAWLAETATGRRPLSGAIHMVDFTGRAIVSWELKQFFPISWSISGFESSSAQTAIEELKLAHSGFLDDDRLPG